MSDNNNKKETLTFQKQYFYNSLQESEVGLLLECEWKPFDTIEGNLWKDPLDNVSCRLHQQDDAIRILKQRFRY